MQAHYIEAPVEYEVKVNRDFVTLRENVYTVGPGEVVRDYRETLEDRSRIRQMVFGGFEKSVYPRQKFDSDPERRFAALLEADGSVIKWIKPMDRQLPIHLRGGGHYVPDFVVETVDGLFLCEVKARNEVESYETQEKARAGALWCSHAGEDSLRHGGKVWSYLLVPDSEIGSQRTFAALAREFSCSADK